MKRWPLVLAIALVRSLSTLALAAPPPATKPGLLLTLKDSQREISLSTPTPHFSLSAGQSLHPLMAPSARVSFSGLLEVEDSSTYTFVAEGAKLRINGQEPDAAGMALAAGKHELVLTINPAPLGQKRFSLRWSSAQFQEEPIPFDKFSHIPTGASVAGEAISAGRNLTLEYNCVACHAGATPAPADVKAPHLKNVGSRIASSWFNAWLTDTKSVSAQARMPNLLIEEDRQHVVAYLSQLRQPGATARITYASDAQTKGQSLFESVGCVACHQNRESFERLAKKTSAAALATLLRDPLAVYPSGRMPSSFLGESESTWLTAYLLFGQQGTEPSPFTQGDAAEGEKLFAMRGCRACHSVDGSGKDLVAVAAPALAQAKANTGCLSSSPGRGLPRYAFTSQQRDAINAYLRFTGEEFPAPVFELARATSALKCGSCHAFNAPAKVAFEESPPPLSQVGQKLQEGWLTGVLLGSKRLRPWMHLRMPHFGNATGEALVPLFMAAAGNAPLGASLPVATDAHAVRNGVRYLGRGEEGLGCINCHDFGRHPSMGATRGPDMVTMTERLRNDWFERWLLDPGRIQPGTQMPNFFGALPASEAKKRVGFLWAALRMGTGIPEPQGLAQNARIKLRVGQEPVAVRTFLTDAPLRTLAVGLPGGINYAFDTATCRLHSVWKGEFLDMTDVWAGRGGEAAQVLGRRIFAATMNEAQLRIGTRSNKARFQSYHRVGQSIELVYALDQIEVHERITTSSTGRGFTRTFSLSGLTDESVTFFTAPQEGLAYHSKQGVRSADGGLLMFTGKAAQRFEISVQELDAARNKASVQGKR